MKIQPVRIKGRDAMHLARIIDAGRTSCQSPATSWQPSPFGSIACDGLNSPWPRSGPVHEYQFYDLFRGLWLKPLQSPGL